MNDEQAKQFVKQTMDNSLELIIKQLRLYEFEIETKEIKSEVHDKLIIARCSSGDFDGLILGIWYRATCILEFMVRDVTEKKYSLEIDKFLNLSNGSLLNLARASYGVDENDVIAINFKASYIVPHNADSFLFFLTTLQTDMVGFWTNAEKEGIHFFQ
jgi:hypothetical protein